MTGVGAILRYSQIEPTFENSSHGQSPSTRPASSTSAEEGSLFIALPNHHIWAPHTIQRAVFSTSSRSRASTTLVVEHYCPEDCCGHPSSVDGIHAPLLRKVQDNPYPEQSRSRSWQHFTSRSSRILPRPLSRLIQRDSQEEPDGKPASTPLLEQALDASARQKTQSSTFGKHRQRVIRRKDGGRIHSV